MKKFRYYDKSLDYVNDKNVALDLHIKLMLSKTNRMFEYKGLPETIPANSLERLLQTNGSCIIASVNGNLYALYGAYSGEIDEYGRYTQYIVSNPWLNYNHVYGINGNYSGDNVECKNDLFSMGLIPIFKKFGTLLTENYITFKVLSISLRSILNMSASDDKTALSAREYLNQLENGKIGVIAENAFFDGVKTHNISNVGNNTITQFIELTQYLKANELQEIGINSSYNMKREYVGAEENLLNDDVLRPFIDSMLDYRKQFCDKCNKLFGTDITVDFGSVWKTNSLEDEKEKDSYKQLIEGDNNGL